MMTTVYVKVARVFCMLTHIYSTREKKYSSNNFIHERITQEISRTTMHHHIVCLITYIATKPFQDIL